MPPSSGSKSGELPAKHTTPGLPVKKCKTTDTLIWFDWSVLFTLVIFIVAVSPWGLLANAVICGVVLAAYRLTLRRIWIRLVPALYTVCSCSACSAVVPPGVDRCPDCKAWFAE